MPLPNVLPTTAGVRHAQGIGLPTCGVKTPNGIRRLMKRPSKHCSIILNGSLAEKMRPTDPALSKKWISARCSLRPSSNPFAASSGDSTPGKLEWVPAPNAVDAGTQRTPAEALLASEGLDQPADVAGDEGYKPHAERDLHRLMKPLHVRFAR